MEEGKGLEGENWGDVCENDKGYLRNISASISICISEQVNN